MLQEDGDKFSRRTADKKIGFNTSDFTTVLTICQSVEVEVTSYLHYCNQAHKIGTQK